MRLPRDDDAPANPRAGNPAMGPPPQQRLSGRGAGDVTVLRSSCPVAYRYRPEVLAGPPAFSCTTLYVVGGVYGNPYALDAIQARASAEPSPPEIVFNGDFHYLDAGPVVFRAVDDGVRAHHATQGNIEYALITADDTLGCGCDYPGYVPDTVVADSDAVVARLRSAVAAAGDCPWLAGLPRYLTVAVGGHRVGIVHGDPENLAGWRLALEAVEPQPPHIRDRTGFAGALTTAAQVLGWFRRAGVDVLCCTHTGLPYAQDFQHPAGRCLVANNGCAGLPCFAGRRHGVLTRLSVLPGVPGDSIYGRTMAGLRFDALPVAYDHDRWITHFLDIWPPGSPARRNYHHRIEHGTWLTPGDAARGTVTASA
jgi:hypothetical protein